MPPEPRQRQAGREQAASDVTPPAAPALAAAMQELPLPCRSQAGVANPPLGTCSHISCSSRSAKILGCRRFHPAMPLQLLCPLQLAPHQPPLPLPWRLHSRWFTCMKPLCLQCRCSWPRLDQQPFGPCAAPQPRQPPPAAQSLSKDRRPLF